MPFMTQTLNSRFVGNKQKGNAEGGCAPQRGRPATRGLEPSTQAVKHGPVWDDAVFDSKIYPERIPALP
jgi:hypothetical protein